ncbi:shikimate kinase [Rhodobium orientis]|uniref:Shikimate kinase n=1 Tax=Rhodobium orientis TaxID=34017 RepID=A0A327JM56_9HYPH|nr:shikimate kinase [Rhodobium orientis]MBB4304904.1 shikimate kinase [Rhodobium orientis]MBK5949231.1 shikimate kinase [Rhodobium orientis]RAI27397.1 shikimate kinase [Rhodobium orientis]
MGTDATTAPPSTEAAAIRDGLGARSVVLVGMMGAGKTSIGRRLAAALGLAFVDADAEIESAANKTIPELFAEHGEAYFRSGERRVIARLLGEGPQVLATGGGAFMDAETRAAIAEGGISVWLKAEFPVLMERVRRKSHRPLLKDPDPEGVMRRLLAERDPVYATADITLHSRDVTHETIVSEGLAALNQYLSNEDRPT